MKKFGFCWINEYRCISVLQYIIWAFGFSDGLPITFTYSMFADATCNIEELISDHLSSRAGKKKR
jgi:hypothetical protein